MGLVLELVARQDELSAANAKLTAENERLRALSGKSSGNSESAWVLRVFLTLETGMMEHGNYRCAAEAAEVSGRAA